MHTVKDLNQEKQGTGCTACKRTMICLYDLILQKWCYINAKSALEPTVTGLAQANSELILSLQIWRWKSVNPSLSITHSSSSCWCWIGLWVRMTSSCTWSKPSDRGKKNHHRYGDERMARMLSDSERCKGETKGEAAPMEMRRLQLRKKRWRRSGSGHVCKSVSCYLLGGAAGMQRLQMRLPGSNGNRVLISSITTPDTLCAESTGYIK